MIAAGPARHGPPSDEGDLAFERNLKRLADDPDLPGHVGELSAWHGVIKALHLDLYKRGDDAESALRNPLGMSPNGPAIDLTRPHGRERMSRHAV